MAQRKIKVMSAVAALSIVASGAMMTQVARAAAPAVWQAQEERGLIVLRVIADGPAGQAGLRRGDILTKFNEIEINDLAGLQAALKAQKAGDEVTLIGRQGDQILSANDVAARLGTIGYEVLSTILARVPRLAE